VVILFIVRVSLLHTRTKEGELTVLSYVLKYPLRIVRVPILHSSPLCRHQYGDRDFTEPSDEYRSFVSATTGKCLYGVTGVNSGCVNLFYPPPPTTSVSPYQNVALHHRRISSSDENQVVLEPPFLSLSQLPPHRITCL
jgi:hypothetical protein